MTLAIVLPGLTAVANIVYNPSVAAMLPQVAGEDDLAAANALNGTIERSDGDHWAGDRRRPSSASARSSWRSPSTLRRSGVSALLVSRMHARSRPWT